MLSIKYVHKRVRLFWIELCSLAVALSASFFVAIAALIAGYQMKSICKV